VIYENDIKLRTTLYIQNGRDCGKFKGCNPLQNCNGLISFKPAIAHFAYTFRYMQDYDMKGKTVQLIEPTIEDYKVIKSIWEDEATMNDVGGIVPIPLTKYQKWFSRMMNSKTDKFFLGYDNVLNRCIGEVSFHRYDLSTKTAELNIKIVSTFRNKGKSTESLNILLNYYFKVFGGYYIIDRIASKNKVGLKMLLNYGFKIKKETPEITKVILSKEDYLNLKSSQSCT